jgi:hypothetical protein
VFCIITLELFADCSFCDDGQPAKQCSDCKHTACDDCVAFGVCCGTWCGVHVGFLSLFFQSFLTFLLFVLFDLWLLLFCFPSVLLRCFAVFLLLVLSALSRCFLFRVQGLDRTTVGHAALRTSSRRKVRVSPVLCSFRFLSIVSFSLSFSLSLVLFVLRLMDVLSWMQQSPRRRSPNLSANLQRHLMDVACGL